MRKLLTVLLLTTCLASAADASQFVQVQDVREGSGARVARHSIALAIVDGGQAMGYELDNRSSAGPRTRDQGIEDAMIGMRVGGERRVTIHEPGGAVSSADIRLIDVAPTIDDMSGRHGNFTLAEMADATPSEPPASPAPRIIKDEGFFTGVPSVPVSSIPVPPPAGSPSPTPNYDPHYTGNFSDRQDTPMPAPAYSDSAMPYSSSDRESSYSVQSPAYAPPAPSNNDGGSLYGSGPSLNPEFPAATTTHEEPSEFYNKGGDSEFFNRGGTTEFHDHNETSDFYHTNTESSQ